LTEGALSLDELADYSSYPGNDAERSKLNDSSREGRSD
jgi:hypothetical protein